MTRVRRSESTIETPPRRVRIGDTRTTNAGAWRADAPATVAAEAANTTAIARKTSAGSPTSSSRPAMSGPASAAKPSTMADTTLAAIV